MNNTVKLVIKIIVAYITTVILGLVSNYGITNIDMILPMVFACVLSIFIYTDRYGKRSDSIYGWIMGSIVSVTYVVGKHVVINDNERYVSDFSIIDIAAIVVLSVFFAAAIVLLLAALARIKAKGSSESLKKNLNKKEAIRYYALTFAIILICYMPYYIGMYPGNLGKDTFESVEMALGHIPMSNHQPIFFTWLIGIVVKPINSIWGMSHAMGVFTLVHMMIYIATLSYVMLWLRQRGCRQWLRWATLGFFALHPFMPMYSIYITKDVLFSCAFVLLILQLYDITDGSGAEMCSGRSTWIRMSIILILMLLLRNNAILICIGLYAALAIVYRKNCKNILISAIVVLISFGIFKGPICNVLHIEASSFAEVASVPLQQVGYVLINNPERIAEGDRVYLEQLLPAEELAEVYTLGYTDPYKFHPDFDDELINSDKIRFLQVWAHILPNDLADYVKVYLAQTVGYWHYGKTNTVCTEGVVENSLGCKQMGIPLFQKLVSYLMLIARKAPLLCILSSMAAQMAMIVLMVTICIRKATYNDKLTSSKIIEYIIPYIPGILLWISIMLATPAYCLLRYMYPTFILWPVMIKELLESGIDEDTCNHSCI